MEHQKQAEQRLLRLFFSGGTTQNMIRSGNSQSLPTFIDERGKHQSPDFNYSQPHQRRYIYPFVSKCLIFHPSRGCTTITASLFVRKRQDRIKENQLLDQSFNRLIAFATDHEVDSDSLIALIRITSALRSGRRWG